MEVGSDTEQNMAQIYWIGWFVVFVIVFTKSNVEANRMADSYRLIIREPIVILTLLIIGFIWPLFLAYLVIIIFCERESTIE